MNPQLAAMVRNWAKDRFGRVPNGDDMRDFQEHFVEWYEETFPFRIPKLRDYPLVSRSLAR